jgi:hypothetical protein
MHREQTKDISFPEAVFLRPSMYTMGGTFEEAIAFLEGYYSGVAKANPYAAPIAEWASFRRWLSEKLSCPASEIFVKFKDHCGDNQTCRDRMLEWLSEFNRDKECDERQAPLEGARASDDR